MKKLIALLGTITALTMAAAPASATVIPIGSMGNPFFTITGATAGDTNVVAVFGDTFTGAGSFDDIYSFILPHSGIGSGSVSTSSSGAGNFLDITSVTINGMPVTVMGGVFAGTGGVPIMAGELDTIEIKGMASGDISTYTGTATFIASAVPEPITWMTFLLGFGFIGMAVRRKLSGDFKTA